MNLRIPAVLIMSFALAALSYAQDASVEREADHQALRELLKKAVHAINNQNIAELQDCFSKEFVFISSDQTVITNGDALVKYYDQLFKNAEAPISKMETEVNADILTRFTDANAGYCFGTSLDTYTLKDGRKVKMQNKWTAALAKENGAWKAAVVHVGVNFLDNPVMTLRTMSIWRKVGIALHLAKPPPGLE